MSKSSITASSPMDPNRASSTGALNSKSTPISHKSPNLRNGLDTNANRNSKNSLRSSTQSEKIQNVSSALDDEVDLESLPEHSPALLNEPSVFGSTHEKWIKTPSDPYELLKLTRELAKEVRGMTDSNSKLPQLKDAEDMALKLDETLRDVEEQAENIARTMMTSTTVLGNLRVLCCAIQKIYEFYDVVTKTRIMFLAKGKLNKRLRTLQSDVRQKTGLLLTSVSLELLSYRTKSSSPLKPRVHLDEPRDINQACYDGHCAFYGIQRPRNYNESFKYYLAAADGGNLESMVALAEIYYYGYGVQTDTEKARAWLIRASELGSSAAKFALARIIITELEVIESSLGSLKSQGDSKEEEKISENDSEFKFQEALKLIIDASEGGNADAQSLLGQLFQTHGDYDEAAKWYNMSYQNGSMHACNLLGMLYFNGQGVPKQREKAYSLFFEAALGGDAGATNNAAMCLEHGIGVEQNIDAALAMYKIGANFGSPQAKYSYGYLLIRSALNNTISGAKDSRQAMMAIGRSNFIQGDSPSDEQLKEGLFWLRASVDGGVLDAAFQLGRLYEQGIGVPFDLASSYSNFLWAAQNGHPRAALCAANIIYENCYGNVSLNVDPDDKKAAALNLEEVNNLLFAASLYHQAARAGLVEGMNAYALMLEDGTACENRLPNVAEAAKWYYAAAEGGLLEAAGNLGLLLASHFELNEVETLRGEKLKLPQLQKWLERIAAAPQIPTSDAFYGIIERLVARTRRMSDKMKIFSNDPQDQNLNISQFNTSNVNDTSSITHEEDRNDRTHNANLTFRGYQTNKYKPEIITPATNVVERSSLNRQQYLNTLPQLKRVESSWEEEKSNRYQQPTQVQNSRRYANAMSSSKQ